MSIFRALILGLVQGATEFLPISSSGHLVLVPFILGWEEPSVGFDVAVHVGTLVSVVWVFRAEIAALARGVFAARDPHQRKLMWLLIVGTIPAVIVGALLGGPLERVFERPVIVALLLTGTGWILLTGQSAFDGTPSPRPLVQMNTGDAISVGVGQAIAVLPGISRSGTTITAGLLRGLEPVAAARYSFLLSVPVILGAAVVKAPDLANGAGAGVGAMLMGVATGAVSGALAIRAFLGIIVRRGLRPFAIYCFFATTAGILAALARG